MSVPSPDFPPATIEAFLRSCAGEWMALRSRFAATDAADAGDGDEWHTSERGELVVAFLEPSDAGSAGGLSVGPKGEPPRHLLFSADGVLQAGDQQGRWLLWPDGSLELVLEQGADQLRERIWFNKPNLRLRSTVEQRADGSLGRASFSSEIRRVSRPAS
ncbi:MAG: CpeS-like protein [Synechococcaceae bacterium WBB_3_034]|nr:CpeS-like protein [Synechococcaceae bacterium WBB_3_034]